MKRSKTNIYHSPKDRALNWPIAGNCHTESDSKSDNSQTLGTCEIAKGQKRRQLRRFRALTALPLPPGPHRGGGNARRLTIYLCVLSFEKPWIPAIISRPTSAHGVPTEQLARRAMNAFGSAEAQRFRGDALRAAQEPMIRRHCLCQSHVWTNYFPPKTEEEKRAGKSLLAAAGCQSTPILLNCGAPQSI